MSEAKIGNKNPNYGNHTSKNKGKENPNYKGNNAKFIAIHMFIAKRKERPNKCENCNKGNCRLELSFNHNLGNHTRNPNDYKYLCCKCHKQRDIKEFGIKFGGIENFKKKSKK